MMKKVLMILLAAAGVTGAFMYTNIATAAALEPADTVMLRFVIRYKEDGGYKYESFMLPLDVNKKNATWSDVFDAFVEKTLIPRDKFTVVFMLGDGRTQLLTHYTFKKLPSDDKLANVMKYADEYELTVDLGDIMEFPVKTVAKLHELKKLYELNEEREAAEKTEAGAGDVSK